MDRQSVFISYSHKDRNIVLGVINAQEGLYNSAFIDSEHTPAGEDWKEYHSEKIRNAGPLVLCWSKNAASSKHVKREWELALNSGVKIIPVLLDDTSLPLELSRFHAFSLREYVTNYHWKWLRYFSNSKSYSILPAGIAIGAGVVVLIQQLMSMLSTGIAYNNTLVSLGICIFILGAIYVVRRSYRWMELQTKITRSIIDELRKWEKSSRGDIPKLDKST